MERYRGLSPEALDRFFEVLALEFDPDPGEVLRLAERYAVSRVPANLIALSRAAEPPRQELLRRLNRGADGTATIVGMRAQLLTRLRQHPEFAAVDADFGHLLASWFNPGFLQLQRIDWRSPAHLLEQIIHHEAVHEIDGWSDLRRRLEPDRRLFAFFHPVLPQEPLIFVEVALLPVMPRAIAPLLDRREPARPDAQRMKVAAFYSISNCQPGLRGVNLGNFLIKRVVEELRDEFPNLKTFCTLSPVPGFAHWLSHAGELQSSRLKPAALAVVRADLLAAREAMGKDGSAREGGKESAVKESTVKESAVKESAVKESAVKEASGKDAATVAIKAAGAAGAADASAEAAQKRLARLCAFYLLTSADADSPLADPVARFHLNNGARLERINPMADLSRKGLKQAHGVMVNYLYDLEEIEANHERFMSGEVSAARAVTSLL
ncbi:MAG: malonyl-CoA decarboxylase [Burkholderiaceae bacterium]|nr:malonyl-CoA decarboxylase [Burkholderiaceae bacterium]